MAARTTLTPSQKDSIREMKKENPSLSQQELIVSAEGQFGKPIGQTADEFATLKTEVAELREQIAALTHQLNKLQANQVEGKKIASQVQGINKMVTQLIAEYRASTSKNTRSKPFVKSTKLPIKRKA